MLATLPAVAAAGFDVHIAASSTGPLAGAIRERGFMHVAWQTQDERNERLPLDRLRSELVKAIERVRPQLLHANSLSTARIVGPVAVQCSVPSLGHLRDIAKLSQQAINDINANRRLIAVSSATRDFHGRQGIDSTKCTVVYNGVDLNELCPRSASGYLHRELGLPPAVRFIVTIGQLGLRKGTDVAMTAVRQIAVEIPEFHWLIAGERTSNKQESREFEWLLKSTATEGPLRGRVHFLGNRSDVAQLLNECELLMHSARQEPLGRVLLEAAASGVAVVATDVGGTREIFPTELDGGLLVPPDDARAIADAVSTLLHNDARRQSLAAAGRRRAEAAFDIRQAAPRLIEQYNEVLQLA